MMYKKNLFNRLCLAVAALLATAIFHPAYAQFEDINAPLVGAGDASLGWADYDLDGDMDLLIAGKTNAGPRTTLYQNNGGTFSAVPDLPFIHVSLGEVAWGDYDNDGDPDLVLTGEMANGTATTQMYRNNGNGTFTDVNAGITAMEESMVDWGDFDNDGDLDFFIAGAMRNGVSTTKIYRNIGGDHFTEIGAGLVGLRRGDGQWFDFDDDGDLDLLLTGRETNNTRRTILYKNTNGSFSAFDTNLPDVDLSAIHWVDTNSNGFKDLLIAGTSDSGIITRIYTHPPDFDGNFNLDDTLEGVEFASGQWVGLPGRGVLQPSVMGRISQGNTTTRIYEEVSGAYTDSGAGVIGLFKGALDWADFDGDGDFDLAIAGFTASDVPVARIYRNTDEDPTANNPPEPPSNIWAARNLADVDLEWSLAYDPDVGPSTGSTYNVRVGTTPGGSDIVSPSATGPGNNGTALSRTLTGLSEGTYYWSIQSIDEQLARSEYAPEQAFAITNPQLGDQFVNIRPNLRQTADFVEWGDLDNDGDLDIILVGVRGDFDSQYTGVHENIDGHFSQRETVLPDVALGNVQLADVDNDNDLDILFQGSFNNPPKSFEGYSSSVYRNDGNFVFSSIGPEFRSDRFCGALTKTWIDADNNGFQDVLIPDSFIGGVFEENDLGVWLNQGGTLNDEPVGWGAGTTCDDAVPADYNNDGKIDLMIAGLENLAFRGAEVKVLTNTGAQFDRLRGPDFKGYSGRPAWGDYDADGDLDVVTSGFMFGVANSRPGPVQYLTGIYRNDISGFTLDASILPRDTSDPRWGDFDADGDLDLLTPGLAGSPLWENRNGTFVNIIGAFDEFESIEVEQAAWGDYDGDDDLDVLLSGWQGGVPVVYVFKNTRGAKNDEPFAPNNLTSTVEGASVTFKWNRGGDEETPSPGLTYNLRVGSSPGASDVFSAESLADGTPLAPTYGNTFHNTFWALNDLDEGTYYWSVQSIDAGFMGSNFAAEQVVVVGPQQPPPDPVDVAFENANIGFTPVYEASAAWADYNEDGLPDLMVSGISNNKPTTILYRNIGTTLVNAGGPFKDVDTGDVAWADYDGDGDLDVLVAGRASDWSFNTILYENTGSGFQAMSTNLPGMFEGDTSWGDYDGDGDPDLLISGMNSSIENFAEVYRNDNGSFTAIGAGLTGIRRGENAWVDYDGDGDLDIMLTGRIDNVINRRSLLYRNDGGHFVNVDNNFIDVDLSSFDWADYDNDGDQDLVLTGATGGRFLGYLYRNDVVRFTQVDINLPEVEFGAVRWGDYDADGDPDIVISGATKTGRVTEVFNNENGLFSPIDAGMTGVSKSAAEWGDFNQDGLLDVFVSGELSGNGDRKAAVYLAVAPPEAPSQTNDLAGAEKTALPAEFGILPNYPNPFNPTTSIRYALPEASQVRISVYDVTGKLIKVLADGVQDAGTYEVVFDGSDLASGVYLTRMETPQGIFMKQMVLLK